MQSTYPVYAVCFHAGSIEHFGVDPASLIWYGDPVEIEVLL